MVCPCCVLDAADEMRLCTDAATVRRARVRSELPYAWIPVLFGIQQLLEGALWLTFPDRAPLLNTVPGADHPVLRMPVGTIITAAGSQAGAAWGPDAPGTSSGMRARAVRR